jgi:hypothetical protein
MTLQIPIPEGFEETLRRSVGGDLAVYVREAVAVDLYRNRKLTHGQLQKFLGVSGYEADTILKNHGGVDDLMPDELAAQVETSRRIRSN